MTEEHAAVAPGPGLLSRLGELGRSDEEANRGLPDLEHDWEFALFGIRYEVIDQVQRALEAEGLSQAELARRMGVSRAYVSKILNEQANFQMETIAKLAVALNREIHIRFHEKPGEPVARRKAARGRKASSTASRVRKSKANPG
ncbi:MAG: helix-turn-helix protein [candidate division BRC1 bacterium ADurb.BinA292]|nr:MAG: helix-turn-helix protein [candidate division BRC1 bacterium ADurb.BinA292]